MKIKSMIYAALITGLILPFLFSCQKLIEKDVPTITISAITKLTATTATSGGKITYKGSAAITAHGVCWSTHQNPTILEHSTNDGIGSGVFVSSITGLESGVTYYARAYATNVAGTAYSSPITFRTMVADVEGNLYHVVTIGTQVCMVEDLKVTHFSNGEPILYSDGLTESAAYLPGDNPTTSGKTYNWQAVIDSRNIAPIGWHVPTNAEWNTLIDYLGGAAVAGGKLKEKGTTNWSIPNTGATNQSGFTAVPNILNVISGSPEMPGSSAYWWSSSLNPVSGNPIYRSLSTDDPSVYSSEARMQFSASTFVSVRCIKH